MNEVLKLLRPDYVHCWSCVRFSQSLKEADEDYEMMLSSLEFLDLPFGGTSQGFYIDRQGLTRFVHHCYVDIVRLNQSKVRFRSKAVQHR